MTDGVRISVRPVFSPEHSDPREPRFVFVYFIRIENLGDRTVQLLTRHWDIHDEVAGDSEVDGEGVVGEQPTLGPGDVHEYNSFCVLRGRSGYMEGWYDFKTADGQTLRALIPRFDLDAGDAGSVPPHHLN
jgi:ApaG protein